VDESSALCTRVAVMTAAELLYLIIWRGCTRVSAEREPLDKPREITPFDDVGEGARGSAKQSE
jgi:hypothetical protein